MPRPLPLVVKKGSKIFFWFSGLMPLPLSLISISAYFPSSRLLWLLISTRSVRRRMMGRSTFSSASRALTIRLIRICEILVLSACSRIWLWYSWMSRLMDLMFMARKSRDSLIRSLMLMISFSAIFLREKFSSWLIRVEARSLEVMMVETYFCTLGLSVIFFSSSEA